MSQDREKILKDAQRLLKSGKVQPAMDLLQKLAESASRDLALLNRIGDLLAIHGRLTEALVYYHKIAEKFAQSGFFPKAIAMFKKILRRDPDRVETLIRMGDLYLQQKLPGEARFYLLHAGDKLVQQQEFALARDVYQRLVDAEPEDPLHRVRHAETLAAEGETELAGEELLTVAAQLDPRKQATQLQQVSSRALDLLPDRAEPVQGVISAYLAQDRIDDAIAFTMEQIDRLGMNPVLAGELAVLYERAGKTDKALESLTTGNFYEVPASVFVRLFKLRLESGDSNDLWSKLDPHLGQWRQDHGNELLVKLYESLASIEETGHIPALQRLMELQAENDKSPAVIGIKERLVEAYKSRSMQAEAEQLESELEEIRPGVEPEVKVDLKSAYEPEPPAKEPDRPVDGHEEDGEQAELPLEVTAPAVPLNRSDEEFVSGRFTQAEILEKYGLVSKAITQIKEVAERFPGQVEAQERLVAILRQEGQTGELQQVLVRLAFARRAGGDIDGAVKAVRDAGEITDIPPDTAELLTRLNLTEMGAEPRASKGTVMGDTPVEEIPATPAIGEESVATDQETLSAPTEDGGESPDVAAEPVEDEIVIDFDDDAPQPETAGEEPGTVSPADLEEIRFYIDHGMLEEARRRIASLRNAGAEGDELDNLEELATKPPAVAEIPPDSGDDDLMVLTRALEDEIFIDEEEPVVPEAGPEQTLEEVFAAFKEHVKDEVASDDYRTHYDLGIAYMEMELLDEAIGEFETSAKDETLLRQSLIMKAMCHRQRDVLEEAVACYQQALQADGGDEASDSGVRYDLAETLLQKGDTQAALELLREVLAAMPTYRDVRIKVAELEASLNS